MYMCNVNLEEKKYITKSLLTVVSMIPVSNKIFRKLGKLQINKVSRLRGFDSKEAFIKK